MPLSLAPFRYRNVLSLHGGVISELRERRFADILGRNRFETMAYLIDEVAGPREHIIYGNAAGSGTSASQATARYIAMSEAIERWAYWETSRGSMADIYGFHRDLSTTGMAAFPGFSSGPVRDIALQEAAERATLALWWDGRAAHCALPDTLALPADGRGIVLQCPVAGYVVTLLWAPLDHKGHVAYGFAAGRNEVHAADRAMRELDRNVRLLREHFRTTPVLPPTSKYETRLLYFAGAEGHARFLERLHRKVKTVPPHSLALVVDARIPGPWDKYAYVWRCLFDVELATESRESDSFFLF